MLLTFSNALVYHGTMKKFKIQRQAYDDDKITTHLQEKLISIHIKPGMPNGTRIVFQEVGDEGPGISPGDLVIITKDLPHEKFKRYGVDLHIAVTLDLCQSLEKLIVELNTLDDRVIRFAITDVIVRDYVKVVHGEGMPYVNDFSKKGDLLIKFDVKMPTYLDETTRKRLIEALLSEDDANLQSPEKLYDLWVSARLKNTHVRTLDHPKSQEGEEEEIIEREQESEPPSKCAQVKIDKDKLYKL